MRIEVVAISPHIGSDVVRVLIGRRSAVLSVDAGDGPELARLMRSLPIVDAARVVVERVRGEGGLEELLDSVDALAKAIATADAQRTLFVDVEPPPP
jgi:hypothetical protein